MIFGRFWGPGWGSKIAKNLLGILSKGVLGAIWWPLWPIHRTFFDFGSTFCQFWVHFGSPLPHFLIILVVFWLLFVDWKYVFLGCWVIVFLGCLVAGLPDYWVVGWLFLGLVRLLVWLSFGCWVVGQLGCWVVVWLGIVAS